MGTGRAGRLGTQSAEAAAARGVQSSVCRNGNFFTESQWSPRASDPTCLVLLSTSKRSIVSGSFVSLSTSHTKQHVLSMSSVCHLKPCGDGNFGRDDGHWPTGHGSTSVL